MSGYRILVTGSRSWTDCQTIRAAIADALKDVQTGETPALVHGGASGADFIAQDVFMDLARPGACEVFKADLSKHGRAAGPIRNAAMIAAGADIVLAFPLGRSVGTRDCMRRAAAVGIPVINHGDPS